MGNFRLFFGIFLAIVLISNVLSYDFQETDKMDISLDISFQLFPKPTSETSIKELSATIYLYPENSQYQKIKSFEPYPKEAIESNHNLLNFSLKNPLVSDYTFGYSSVLEKSKVFTKINKKISYPNEVLMSDYLKPTKIIDYEDYQIKEIAKTLSFGEDDYVYLVYKTALWVKENIHYKKTSETEKSQLPASWVMYNRYGVCDEISAIFAAILRAQGIPSRLVSGIAYSESIEEAGFKNWGLHAWNEVYFPDFGWVAFDIAFDQYFGVDASHINLMYYDEEKSSFEYSWRSKNTKFESSELNFNVDFIKESSDSFEADVNYKLSPKYSLVGFGSYNEIELTIENLKNYYIPLSLQFSMPSDVIILNPSKSNILLRPNEKIVLRYIVKFPHNLDPGYVYSYPVNIYLKSKAMVNQTISVSPKYEIYSLEEFNKVTDEKQKVRVECVSQLSSVVVGKSADFKCFVYNNNHLTLKDRICLEDSCYPFEISPNDFLAFDFKKTFNEPKTQEINFTISNDYFTLFLDVYDVAKIEISNFSITDPDLSKDLLLSAMLSPKSSSPVINLSVYIYLEDKVLSEWHEEQLMIPSVFGVNIQKYLLKENSSKVGIYAEYYDISGDKLSARAISYTPMFQRGFFERIYAFLMRTGYFIDSMFSNIDSSYNQILGAFYKDQWKDYKVFKS